MLLQKITLKMKRSNNIKKKTKEKNILKKGVLKKFLLISFRGRKGKGKRV